MPVTNRDFILAHYDEIKTILDRHNIKQCFLGHFTRIGLQMMLDTASSKDFYQVEDELEELALSKDTVFTLKFCSLFASGQEMLIPSDSLDFYTLGEEIKTSETHHSCLEI